VPELRNYHVVLHDGTERNVRAKDVSIDEGVLSFTNGTQLQVAYAAGMWRVVETEQKDDKG
jgi:hypothetical protein